MTKSELAAILEIRRKISGARAQLIVDEIFASMSGAFHRGENISIRGFGSFMLRRYRPYLARNPETGKAIPVKSRRHPTFIMSREILGRLNKGSLQKGNRS